VSKEPKDSSRIIILRSLIFRTFFLVIASIWHPLRKSYKYVDWGWARFLAPRYSDDLKEVLQRAKRLAKKHRLHHVSDRALLQSLLENSRLFSRSDALLRTLGAKPPLLKKAVKELPWHPQAAHNSLEDAEQANPNRKIGVEHLLTALSESPDPDVNRFMRQFDLTPEHLPGGVNRVEKRRLKRATLFFVRELVEVAVVVLFFLVVIKEGLGDLRLIPSESMLPLLQVQDRIVIEKLTRWWRPVERGDVLVFYPPMTRLYNDPMSMLLRSTGISNLIYQKEDQIDVAYIKRVVGLPGDTVEVRPGQGVLVNGQWLKEPYVYENANSCTFVHPVSLCGPVTVPEGYYYMMGDNRNQSSDSRYWGFQPQERVIGRAVFRIWPLPRLGPLPAATDAS
jgi:signal peptidase I